MSRSITKLGRLLLNNRQVSQTDIPLAPPACQLPTLAPRSALREPLVLEEGKLNRKVFRIMGHPGNHGSSQVSGPVGMHPRQKKKDKRISMVWTDQKSLKTRNSCEIAQTGETQQPKSSPAPVKADHTPNIVANYDGPTIRAMTDDEVRALKWSRIEVLDLPPSDHAFDADESGMFWVVYTLAHGMKHSIYNPLKRWLLDERPQFIDSKGRVQTWEGPVDHTDALGALGQIGMLFLPGEEATSVGEEIFLGESKILLPGEQGTLDEAVALNQTAWKTLTHGTPSAAPVFSLGQDLSALSELTIIEHGAARNIAAMAASEVGAETVVLSGVNATVGPNTLAELMAQSGWRGGYIRLIACSTGMPSESGLVFAEQLSVALAERGLPTVVAAPKGLVEVGSTLWETDAPIVRLRGEAYIGTDAFYYFGP